MSRRYALTRCFVGQLCGGRCLTIFWFDEPLYDALGVFIRCVLVRNLSSASVPSQVYSMATDFMSSATQRFSSDEFISFDESSDRPWGFKQVGRKTDSAL